MDSASNRELASIKAELSSIIKELTDISNGVRNDFEGIDSHLCSNCINTVIDSCKQAQKRLNRLDTTTVTKAYKQAHK